MFNFCSCCVTKKCVCRHIYCRIVILTAQAYASVPTSIFRTTTLNSNIDNQINYLVSLVPVSWALKLYIISWFSQKLSSLFLKKYLHSWLICQLSVFSNLTYCGLLHVLFNTEAVCMCSISCWWNSLSRWKEWDVPTSIVDTEQFCQFNKTIDCGT